MLFSDLTGKNTYVGEKKKGVCKGIGISPKTQFVKYLLCSFKENSPNFISDFAFNFTALEKVESSLCLNSARTTQGRNCIKLFIGLPIFYNDGGYLGHLQDVEIENSVAVNLLTSNGEVFPVFCILACQDALILRREQPFPIGQRIPAPVVSKFLAKNTPIVTKAVLKESMKKGALIRLTLSLSPFNVQEV